jgi:hypothetical protein
MTTPVRFSYDVGGTSGSQGSLLAYLPILLSRGERSIATVGLLDTGSTVNVLPYTIGLELGLVWEEQTTPVVLTGSLGRVPARGVILHGQVEPFAPVELAFAWTQLPEAPLLLGQINFFLEFEVCFFRAQSAYEVKPRSK